MVIVGRLYRRREGGAYVWYDAPEPGFLDLPACIDVDALPDGQPIRVTIEVEQIKVEPITEESGEE